MAGKLPSTIFERIGSAAVAIQNFFITKGFVTSKNDRAIWNNISFVIAFLEEFNLISAVAQIHLQLKFKHMYKDEDESFACELWIREGVSFYRRQINDMKYERHTLPDVIVYNLLHPDVEKLSFEELSVFDIDIVAAMECWTFILETVDLFFLNDDNFKNLPLGC